MTTPEDAIRARRRLTNKLIAAHEAARLKPFFAPDIRLIAGDGALILGAEAVVEAFGAQFADPDFVTYVRTPERVELDVHYVRSWSLLGDLAIIARTVVVVFRSDGSY